MHRIALGLILALVLPAPPHAATVEPAPATVSACFTPGPQSCAEQIVDRIDAARASVRVQAYYLTQPLILRAIAAAKRRGLEVEAVLDKSQDRQDNPRSRYTGATYLANAGVPLWIDDAPAIAHSKVIILDGREVITGSLNFTKSADTRNAENVVTIDSSTVAAWFTRNWKSGGPHPVGSSRSSDWIQAARRRVRPSRTGDRRDALCPERDGDVVGKASGRAALPLGPGGPAAAGVAVMRNVIRVRACAVLGQVSRDLLPDGIAGEPSRVSNYL